MPHQKMKGLIFDLDGTIIDTLGAYTEAFNRGTAAFGLPPVSAATLAGLLDRGVRLGDMLTELFPSVFSDEQKRQRCRDVILKAYLQLQSQDVQLQPGARQVLQSLKERGIKIGIVTGRMTQGDGKWLELETLGIRGYIDAQVTAAEAPGKPSPDGLLKCVKELGFTVDECVFVGDSRIDVIAGKNAGMRTVAVHNGVAGRELLAEQKPDCILADLTSLLPCLESMENKKEV